MSWLVADQIAELLDMYRDVQPVHRKKAYDKMSSEIMSAIYAYTDTEYCVDKKATKE